MATSGEKIEGKLDKMFEKFCSVEERLKTMDSKFENKLEKIETQFDNLLTEMRSVQAETKKQAVEVQTLQKELKAVTKRSEEALKQCNFRISNLEDRQRRRNLRLRGFRRSFAEGKTLFEAFKLWLETYEVHLQESDIERIHWSFGRRDPQGQRDIVVAFVSERKADQIYKFLRSQPALKCSDFEIRILRDLSRQTLNERAILRPIASSLFQNDIRFTWTFPTAILVFKDQQMFKARTLEEGRDLLQKLDIQIPEGAEAKKVTIQLDPLLSDSSGKATPEEAGTESQESLISLEAAVAAVRKKSRQTRAKK